MPKNDYFNDDSESDFGDDDSLLGNERQGEEVKPWDKFEIIHYQPNTGSTVQSKFIDNGVKVLKAATIIVVFLVVLCGAVLSKTSTLLMTSQIKKNITRPYCNKGLDITRQYVFSLPTEERITWIWLLIFAYFVPEMGSFLRSARILLFKSWEFPNLYDALSILFTESLSAIGSSLLIFTVLPEMDVIKGAMLTNAVCFVPAVGFLFRNIRSWNIDFFFTTVLDILAILSQASAFVVWPLVEDNRKLWTIPVAVFLISFGWWENFIYDDSGIKFLGDIASLKKDFPNGKYLVYCLVSVIKSIVFFGTTLFIIYCNEGDILFLFDKFSVAFSERLLSIAEIVPTVEETNNVNDAVSTGAYNAIHNNLYIQLTVWLVNIGCTYICYAFGKFACKTMVQGISFAFPIALTVPMLLTFLIMVCGWFAQDACAFHDIFPEYIFFNVPTLVALENFVGHQHVWVWLFWLLSQIWITQHIWVNKNSKLAATEKLFMRPMYDAFLVDQSIAMNRRSVVDEIVKSALGPEDSPIIDENKITRIYACATMWHETPEEMLEFLKSIFRMDTDQAAHRLVKQHFERPVDSHYEWETHIFFDDAFVRKSKEDNDPHLNSYVMDLIQTIPRAAEAIHKTKVKIRPPIIYSTPYGGRLVWTLPGKTKLIVHLKDKAKIRAKKRWSQVMYMYYLLGHKIIDNDKFTEEECKLRSKNTYLLALDGDIDFQPDAVHLLIQYMKKKDNLGAACGRIHPVGNGAMAWYQIFEYAVGHWMQKATEHVIGCVLCSPGCFSLFRASALMDHNVMARYTTVATEARHYVQYDQGEDRWLCTLLLQRGYRVEYSAASDAYTHCPEGFKEFYNQRRRWMPSTTANILDLLTDSSHIKKVNDNISTFYVLYQFILMIGTAIGPGSIFLMLIGAFATAFGLTQWQAFWYNIIPVAIFVATCILCKSETQLFVAAGLSGFYGLVMMAVMIGVLMQIKEDGPLAPSSLFFFVMMGEYVVAAFLHPKEFYCLKYGIIYLVTVPSMYMLLVIYSVFNMNNVSWGTREVTVATEKQEEKKEEAKKTPQSMILGWIYKIRDFFASCQKGAGELIMINESLRHIQQKVDHIDEKVEELEKLTLDPDSIEPRKTGTKRKTTIIEGSRVSRVSGRPRPSGIRKSVLNQSNVIIDEEYDDFDYEDSLSSPSDDLQNNSWIYDGELIRGHLTFLDKKEEIFWKELLDKYLHPIEDDKEKVARDLKDLRDKMALTFFAINALYVLVIFLLTLQKDIIHIPWPMNPAVNFTYDSSSGFNQIIIQATYLELEPIGLVFLVFFFLIMGIQFLAMIIHRFGTYSQILANTDLDLELCDRKVEEMTEDDLLDKDPIKIFKKLMKLKGINGDDQEEDKEVSVGRRNTVAALVQKKDKKRAIINDLDTAFQVRLGQIARGEKTDVAEPRKTLAALHRRVTMVQRKSQFKPNFDPSAFDSFRPMMNQQDLGPQTVQFFDNPAFDVDPESKL